MPATVTAPVERNTDSTATIQHVEDLIATSLRHQQVYNQTDKITQKLPVESVSISGTRFVQTLEGAVDETLTISAKIPGSVTLDPAGVEKALMDTVQGQLNSVTVVDKDGKTRLLGSYYDFSDAPEKTHVQIVAETKAAIDTFLEKIANDPNPDNKLDPSLVKLLTEWKGYDNHNRPHSYLDKPDGKVAISFYDWGEDKKDVNGVDPYVAAEQNILNRKTEIVEAVKEAALRLFQEDNAKAKDTPPFTAQDFEQLKQLDLVVRRDRNLQVTLGTPVKPAVAGAPAAPPPKPEDLLAATPLNKLSDEQLKRIVNDAVLLAGKDADQAASLLADGSDMRAILERAALARPALANDITAIKESDLFSDSEERKKRDENKPIKLSVHSSRENPLLSNDIRAVTIPLPAVLASEVIGALGSSDKTVKINDALAAALAEQKKDGGIRQHGFAARI